MARILGCSILWLVFAIAIANAHPARPLYEPPAPAEPAATSHALLPGSAWIGNLGKVMRVFIFEPDGTLSYKTSVATPAVLKNRGSWKLEGDTVYFAYALKKGAASFEFRGTMQGIDTIVGEYQTKAGAKTPMTLQRTILEKK